MNDYGKYITIDENTVFEPKFSNLYSINTPLEELPYSKNKLSYNRPRILMIWRLNSIHRKSYRMALDILGKCLRDVEERLSKEMACL